jgi:RimJ/RimL family protein N-acetyltransferase
MTTHPRDMPASLDIAGFLLRPFVASDAPAFAAAVRESVSTVGKWMNWAHANYSEADALAWFAWCDTSRANGTAHEFGIFLPGGDALVGGAGLNQFNTVNAFCNLGYWVRESAQRRGTALSAISALGQYGFEHLNQSRIEIVVAAGNTPSFEAAKKSGANYECLAQNRLILKGKPVAAHVFSIIAPALN